MQISHRRNGRIQKSKLVNLRTPMHKVYRQKDLREHLVAKMYGQKFDFAGEPNEEPKRSHLKSRLKVVDANILQTQG